MLLNSIVLVAGFIGKDLSIIKKASAQGAKI